MKNKFVLLLMCVAIALMGVMVWHSQRPSTDSARNSPDSGSQEMAAASGGTQNKVGNGRMVVTARFNDNPVKPEELESLQLALRAGKELNPSQINTVSRLLREVSPDDEGQLGHVRKNELMNELNRQPKLPPNTLDLYATIYRSPAQNEVIRDYALQHVYEAYAKLPDDARKDDAVSLLREAAADAHSSIAGTAILALARLSNADPNLSRAGIAAMAFDLAQNPSANASARISALQVIGQLDAGQAVPVLVEAVQQGISIPEQISAIGALGLVGGPDQVPLLQTIAAGDNARLKPAALGALRKIEQRLGAF